MCFIEKIHKNLLSHTPNQLLQPEKRCVTTGDEVFLQCNSDYIALSSYLSTTEPTATLATISAAGFMASTTPARAVVPSTSW